MPLTHLQIKEILDENRDHECGGFGRDHVCVKIVSIAELPTRFGTYQVVAFWNNKDGKEHAAFVHGDITGEENVPVRLHSECLTGDAIGSLRCDCRDQLEAAMRYIAAQSCGVVIYLKQEGRGIGLLNKLKAYQLQDLGLDTVEANQYLNLPVDARDYKVAASIIDLLKIRSVSLLTNNPDKIDQLKAEGINVVDRIPIVIPGNGHDEGYLEVKREKMGHLL